MKAAFYTAFGEPFGLETVPDPTPEPHGVVIEVQATGLCRSDWHGWMGHDPDIQLPHVPGHEFAGVVVAVGHEVRNWRGGERVTLPFVCACGRCPVCGSGNHQVCPNQTQPGFSNWGSFAPLVAVDHADVNLVALPDEMSFTTAASLGCRFATAFRAVIDQGRVRAGEWVAVHGCGGVGLSAVMVAAAAGARVVAVDISPGALALAREAGAEEVVDAGSREGSRDVAPDIIERTGGGAHLSLDALGSPTTAWNSVACLGTRGRHVQVGLLPAGAAGTPLPMDRVVARELELLGSHGMQAHRYPEMMALIGEGRLR
ncbi:MAG: alcohol dehydrogenase, partial [Gemmatimonadales bacterium]